MFATLGKYLILRHFTVQRVGEAKNRSLIPTGVSVQSGMAAALQPLSCSEARPYPFPPDRRHAHHRRVNFHFVSDEGKVVEAELNMPRGAAVKPVSHFQGQTNTYREQTWLSHLPCPPPSPPRAAGGGQGRPPRCSRSVPTPGGRGLTRTDAERTCCRSGELTFRGWKSRRFRPGRRLHSSRPPIDQRPRRRRGGCVAFHQPAGAVAVFNSVSGYPRSRGCRFRQLPPALVRQQTCPNGPQSRPHVSRGPWPAQLLSAFTGRWNVHAH